MTDISTRKKSTLSFLAAFLAACVFLAIACMAQKRFSYDQVKNFLAFSEAWVLWLNIFLIALSLWRLRERILEAYRRITRDHLKKLGLIIFMALAVRLFIAPDTHRLYFDEDIYLSIAQNMVCTQRTIATDFGTYRWDDYECRAWFLNKQPNALPALLSLVFFVFGANEASASLFILVLSTLTPLLIYFLTRVLFDGRSALWAALAAALLPLAVIWARVPSTETAAAFFMLLTMILVALYRREGGMRLLAAMLFTISFTVQFRPEGVLFIIAAAVLLADTRRRLLRDCGESGFAVIWFFFCLIQAFHALHMLHFIHEPWGVKEGGKFGLQYAAKNLKDNLLFFLVNREIPLLYSIAAFLGLFFGTRKTRLERLTLFAWVTAFFLPYVFFYAGSYRYGVDVRFALHIMPPVMIFTGLGLRSAADMLTARFQDPMVSRYVATAVLLTFITFMPFIRTVHEESWQARWDHDFIVSEVKKLPRDAIVFYHSPYIIILNCQRGAAQTFLGFDEALVDLVFQCSDHVYYAFDYWTYDPELMNHFQYYAKHFEMTPVVREKMYDREYVIFRITRK